MGVSAAKVLDIGLDVSEFKFQSLHYIRFRTNTLGKGTNSQLKVA